MSNSSDSKTQKSGRGRAQESIRGAVGGMLSLLQYGFTRGRESVGGSPPPLDTTASESAEGSEVGSPRETPHRLTFSEVSGLPSMPGLGQEEIIIGSESGSAKTTDEREENEEKSAALQSRFPALSPPGSDMVAEVGEPSAQLTTLQVVEHGKQQQLQGQLEGNVDLNLADPELREMWLNQLRIGNRVAEESLGSRHLELLGKARENPPKRERGTPQTQSTPPVQSPRGYVMEVWLWRRRLER